VDDYQYRQPSIWIEGYQSLEPEEGSTTKQLREQLALSGAYALSTPDLLAIILRTGSGSETIVQSIRSLLSSFSLQDLLQADFGELYRSHGLGKVKAAQLQAILEVARRLTLPMSEKKYTIRSPADAANLVMADMVFLDHEQLRVLVLDTKNQVVANLLLYKGTVNSSVLRVVEIFRPAIARQCPGIILCHNHPSGVSEPSQEDLDATQQLVEAGKILEIEVIDHLIIGNQCFVSIRERLRW